MSAATTARPRQTWDQRRAEHAWNAVEKLARAGENGGAGMSPDQVKEYGNLVKETSTRILTAGLGQALAYLLAKAGPKTANRALHDHLADWLKNGRRLPVRDAGKLIQTIIESDSIFLRRATDEALAYLNWLARFAEARGGAGQ